MSSINQDSFMVSFQKEKEKEGREGGKEGKKRKERRKEEKNDTDHLKKTDWRMTFLTNMTFTCLKNNS